METNVQQNNMNNFAMPIQTTQVNLSLQQPNAAAPQNSQAGPSRQQPRSDQQISGQEPHQPNPRQEKANNNSSFLNSGMSALSIVPLINPFLTLKL